MALSLKGAEEGSHMGQADFRVGGHIFATLAMQKDGFGNLMLTPELQKKLIDGAPDVFLPVPGGWGRNGATHIRLAKANENQLYDALHVAWQLRIDKNGKAKTRSKKRKPKS
jgi:hypothetical protein